MRKLTRQATWFVLILFCGVLSAQTFNPPARLAEDISGYISDAVITMDKAGNPVIAFVADNRIYFGVGHDGFTSIQQVTMEEDVNITWDLVSMNTNSTGATFLTFRQTNGKGSEKIQWTCNTGGRFNGLETIYESSEESLSRPTVDIVSGSEFVVCWNTEDIDNVNNFFLFEGETGQTQSFQGRDAAFDCDRFGVIHTAFIRDGHLYYSNNSLGDFSLSETQLTQSDSRIFNPIVAADSNGRCHVLYWEEIEGNKRLVLCNDTATRSLVVTDKPVVCQTPYLTFAHQGNFYQVIYEEEGILKELAGIIGIIGERKDLCDITEEEQCGQIVLDENGIYHRVYIDSGALFYANTSRSPMAEFTATPEQGRYPLTVQFQDTSGGYYLKHFWDFGDGQTSLQRNPTHVYTEVGVYSVTLRVTGTSGSTDEIVKEDLITVEPKKNFMFTPDMAVYAGTKGLRIPIRVTNEFPICGFQVSARYDPDVLEIADGDDAPFVDFNITKAEIIDPEFVGAINNVDEGYFVLGVVFDIIPPIVGKKIQSGEQISIVNIVADIPAGVPHRHQTQLLLENGLGEPPVRNSFSNLDATSVFPELHSGVITIIRPDFEFLGPIFLRGDANNDGKITLADPVAILSYQFGGGDKPFCLDAADVDDNGNINLADPIGLLSFMFVLGMEPSMPYPSFGLDPSADDLTPCGQ